MRSGKRHPVVFLDRDGTLLAERGYLGDPRKIRFYPTVFSGLRRLQRLGYKLVILSNQSGVARGYFTKKDVHRVNKAVSDSLVKQGVRITRIYYCPHAPHAKCGCRKPRPGLALRAQRDLKLDLSQAFVIGDQDRDYLLAKAIRATPILVLTGAGGLFKKAAQRLGIKVTSNLDTASRWIGRQVQAV